MLQRPLVCSDLIYDVGLFDGGDTAYYLFRGYRVVAVDANPLMIEKARLRFPKELHDKRLTLLNAGISEAAGTANFYISDVPEWSSFDQAIASRDRTACKAVVVPVVAFSRVIAEYGVPHYLKVDIEGNDRFCVDAIRGTIAPRYLSVESECVGDSKVLRDEESVATLELLRDVGYRKFKLVNQHLWRPVRAAGVAHFCARLITSAARGRLRMGVYANLADKFTDHSRIARLKFPFSAGSTGPWGDDIPGAWMTFKEARSTYLRERHAYFSKERALYSFWYDWHATY